MHCSRTFMTARKRLSRLYGQTKRWLAAAPFLLMSAAANAQSTGNLGANLLEKTCEFLRSPLVIFIFVVAIFGCIIMLVLDEGKGLGSKVVKIVIGAAVLMSIGTIIGLLGLTGAVNC